MADQSQQPPSSPIRQWLRDLPTFDTPSPPFDAEDPPSDPVELFTQWIGQASEVGISMPHAAVLSTASAGGVASGRTLILKDLDEAGWTFATQPTSPKALDLADNPRAALTFLWTAVRRQVRVQGSVQRLDAEVSAADYLERHPRSRASVLTGYQSEPLVSLKAQRDAYAKALATVEAEPDAVAENWACYQIRPDFVEFWQSTTEGQVRLRYERDGDSWRPGLRWP